MFRLICRTLTVLILVVLLGGIGGWVILPTILSSEISKVLKVNTRIGHIPFSVNPFGVDYLRIDNPEKYNTLPNALLIQTTRVFVPLRNYIKQEIVIDEVAIDGMYMGLQFNSSTDLSNGNWQEIVKNINTTLSKYEKTVGGRTVKIKRLVVKNIKVDLLYKSNSEDITSFKFKKLKFENIRSDRGPPIGQILNVVLGKVLLQITLDKNINAFKETLKLPQKALSTAKKTGKAIKDLTEQFKKGNE